MLVLTTDRCRICDLSGQQSSSAGQNRVQVSCKLCGEFQWEPLIPWPTPIPPTRKVNLSAFVRELNAVGIVPLLDNEQIKSIQSRRRPRIRDRAMRALSAIVEEVGYNLSITFPLSERLRIHALSYSEDDLELSVLLDVLEFDGLIKTAGMIPKSVRLTPAGLIQAEELKNPGTDYVQGFVAMSFNDVMNDAYMLGFDPGIRAAGYRPFRIDTKEHINGISDEILTEIRRSRFLVADYTLGSNGVYFEAGVASGLGIPIIATCRADYLDKLHFDIKHINTLKWETPAQLALDLERRISGTIGSGPLAG